jgi:hypothetical protein
MEAGWFEEGDSSLGNPAGGSVRVGDSVYSEISEWTCSCWWECEDWTWIVKELDAVS